VGFRVGWAMGENFEDGFEDDLSDFWRSRVPVRDFEVGWAARDDTDATSQTTEKSSGDATT
jgi:hypothetical protein